VCGIEIRFLTWRTVTVGSTGRSGGGVLEFLETAFRKTWHLERTQDKLAVLFHYLLLILCYAH